MHADAFGAYIVFEVVGHCLATKVYIGKIVGYQRGVGDRRVG